MYLDRVMFLTVLDTLIEQKRILGKKRGLIESAFSLILDYRENVADPSG